jgi:hypothetical protein
MTEQAYLQNNPAKASREVCAACRQRIGDSKYTVDADGIVKHKDCLMHALTLIKCEIIPIDQDQNIVYDRNYNLHAAVQIIVTVARKHGLLLEHGGR